MRLIPNSWGTPLREANSCHTPAGSPEGGRFCSDVEGNPREFDGYTKYGKVQPSATAVAAIMRGEPQRATEEEFLAHHYTGHIGADSYKDYEAGKFEYIRRAEFTELVNSRKVNGETVEIRVQAEPAQYAKRRLGLSQEERDRLYEEYEAAARALGTTPMGAGLDLGRDSAEYKALGVYEQRWLQSGEDWQRDAQNNLVYYTPEEMKASGLSPFTYTVGAFVGDKAIGYAGDEFGASGVYVSKAYQRNGLGVELLKTFLERSGRKAKGSKIGQMTYGGQATTRALYRAWVKDANTRLSLPPKPKLMREANDCHTPAGSPAGGQFCSGGGVRITVTSTPGDGGIRGVGRSVDQRGVTHVDGYVELYHGTSRVRASKIAKEGFRIRAVRQQTMGGDPEGNRDYVWFAKQFDHAKGYAEIHANSAVVTVRIPRAEFDEWTPYGRNMGPDSVWLKQEIPAKYVHSIKPTKRSSQRLARF